MDSPVSAVLLDFDGHGSFEDVCSMLKIFRVELPSGSVERVEADTLQVRDGCLIFSRVPTRSELREDDPRVSRAYAPGSWRTVEETK